MSAINMTSADKVQGTNGDDIVYGSDVDNHSGRIGQGDDQINVGYGDNIVYGGAGNDTIKAYGAGSNYLDGGDGHDSIIGGWGKEGDVLVGGAGNDVLNGVGTNDTDVVIYSGNKSDYDISDPKTGWKSNFIVVKDLRDGSPDGTDAIQQIYTEKIQFADGLYDIETTEFEKGVFIHIGNNVDVEVEDTNKIVGTDHDDVLIGSDENNYVIGNKGDDTLIGNKGDDYINGGKGKDLALFAGKFSEYKVSKKGVDTIVVGPDGRDQVREVEFLQFDDGVLDVENNKFNKNQFLYNIPAGAQQASFMEGTILAVQDISTYPLARIPADMIVYEEMIIKPIYGLSQVDVLDAAQAKADELAKKAFPDYVPVVKMINYVTDELDALVLPSAFNDLYTCESKLCNHGNPVRGKAILDKINKFEADNTQAITGMTITMIDNSQWTTISALRIFDEQGNRVDYTIHGGIDGWGSHRDYARWYIKDDNLSKRSYFWAGWKKGSFEITFPKPIIPSKAEIAYGREQVPELLTITDSNGKVLFQNKPDTHLYHNYTWFTFIK